MQHTQCRRACPAPCSRLPLALLVCVLAACSCCVAVCAALEEDATGSSSLAAAEDPDTALLQQRQQHGMCSVLINPEATVIPSQCTGAARGTPECEAAAEAAAEEALHQWDAVFDVPFAREKAAWADLGVILESGARWHDQLVAKMYFKLLVSGLPLADDDSLILQLRQVWSSLNLESQRFTDRSAAGEFRPVGLQDARARRAVSLAVLGQQSGRDTPQNSRAWKAWRLLLGCVPVYLAFLMRGGFTLSGFARGVYKALLVLLW